MGNRTRNRLWIRHAKILLSKKKRLLQFGQSGLPPGDSTGGGRFRSAGKGIAGNVRMQPGVKRTGVSDFFPYTPSNDGVPISKNQQSIESFGRKLGIESAKRFSQKKPGQLASRCIHTQGPSVLKQRVYRAVYLNGVFQTGRIL